MSALVANDVQCANLPTFRFRCNVRWFVLDLLTVIDGLMVVLGRQREECIIDVKNTAE